MRKLFISADMEGSGGVASPNALAPERWMWEWGAARRWMTSEVNAAAEAAFAAGYGEVVVSDSHGNSHNIDPDLLPDNVLLVRGWPRPLLHMQGCDDAEVDACAFIGYHAGATTQDSILAHTYSGAAFRWIKLNDEYCSEGYMNAALAGEFGKPVVFVSGDDQTLDDAKRYAPEAVSFASKKAIGVRSQSSLPPLQVSRYLKSAVEKALSSRASRPLILPAPYHLHIEMTTQAAAEMLAYLPTVERKDAYGVTVTFNKISAAMRFIACAMLYSPTGVPAL
jgi:D-amino peptidase